jgi:hypothetical protein
MWSCPQCTFENDPISNLCDMCDFIQVAPLVEPQGSQNGVISNHPFVSPSSSPPGAQSNSLPPPISDLNVIDLVNEDDQENNLQWLRVNIEEDSIDNIAELKVLLPISLESFKQRCLDELDLWNVSECNIRRFDEDAHRWFPVSNMSDVMDGAALKVVITSSLLMKDVKVLNVGPRISCPKALKDYNSQLLDNLANKFCAARRIRGDGNCFYRAIIFRTIEALCNIVVDKGSQKKLDQLEDLLGRLCGVDGLDSSDQAQLVAFADDLTAEVKECMENGTELDPTYLKKNINKSTLDGALVRAARRCIGVYLLDIAKAEQKALLISHEASAKEDNDDESKNDHRSDSSQQILLTDVVAANFDELSVPEFIDTVVLQDDRDAEDVIIAFAGRVFGIKLVVWQPDKENNLMCLAHGTEVNDAQAEVHVLLYQSHYNLLYKRTSSNASINDNGHSRDPPDVLVNLESATLRRDSNRGDVLANLQHASDKYGSSSSSSSSSDHFASVGFTYGSQSTPITTHTRPSHLVVKSIAASMPSSHNPRRVPLPSGSRVAWDAEDDTFDTLLTANYHESHKRKGSATFAPEEVNDEENRKRRRTTADLDREMPRYTDTPD